MTGTEINKAVARKLGWSDHDLKMIRHIPDYCHDIGAAWEIIQDRAFMLERTPGGFYCEIYTGPQPSNDFGNASADTAPRAICLAFLKVADSK